MKKKYILNGKIYYEDDLAPFAKENNMALVDYINEVGAKEHIDTNMYELNGKEYSGDVMADYAKENNMPYLDYLNEVGAKKKVVSDVSSKDLPVGASIGTTSTIKDQEIPVVDLTPPGEEKPKKAEIIIGETQAIPQKDETKLTGLQTPRQELYMKDGVVVDNTILKEFEDFPKGAEQLEVKRETGEIDRPYSRENLLKLRDEDYGAYKSKMNAIKNQFAIREKAGTSKGNEYAKLQLQDLTGDSYQDASNFIYLKNKQKEIVNETLSGDDRRKALDRINEDEANQVERSFTPQTAKDYISKKFKQEYGDVDLDGMSLDEVKNKIGNDVVNRAIFSKYEQFVNPKSLEEGVDNDNADKGSRLKYIGNSFLNGMSSVSTGLSDLMFQLLTYTFPEKAIGGEGTPEQKREQALAQWRQQAEPTIRNAMSQLYGAEVGENKQKQYEKEFWTSALGGLSASIPMMVAPYGTGLFLGSYDAGLQSIENTEQAKNLPESTKTIFAAGVGTAGALLEKLGLDKIFGKQTKKIAINLTTKTLTDLMAKSSAPITAKVFEVALRNSANTLKDKVINAGGKIAKGAAVEFLTGSAQEGVNVVAENIVNASQKKQIFDPQTMGEVAGRIFYSGLQEGVGGGIFGTVSAFTSKTRNYISEKVAEAKTQQDINNLRKEVLDQAQKNKIGKAEIDQLNNIIDQYVEINAKIPADIPNRKEVINKVSERDELKNQIEQKKQELQSADDAFKADIQRELNSLQGRYNEMNEEISSIGKPEEIVPTTEVKTTLVTPTEVKTTTEEVTPTPSVEAGSVGVKGEVDLGGGIKNKVSDKGTNVLPIAEIDNLRSQKQTNLVTGNAVSLENDLSKNGIKEPLVITYYPNEGKAVLTDGHNRLDVAKDMGAERLPIRIVEQYTDAPNNAKDWTPPKAVEQSLKETPKAELPQQKEAKVEAPKEEEKPEIKLQDKDNQVEFTTSSGRQKVNRVGDEIVVTDAKTGNPVSKKTYKKAVDEYIANFDFSKGEEGESVKPTADKNEILQEVVNTSNNPLQLARVYGEAEMLKPSMSDINQMISDYGIGKTTPESFRRYGDVNQLTREMRSNYVANKKEIAVSLDEQAKDISEHYFPEGNGTEITAQDLIDFMYEFPSRKMIQEKINPVAYEAAQKFKKLTGIDLNTETANKVIDQSIKRLEQQEKDILNKQYESEQQLENDYWEAFKATDGFTKEAPIAEVARRGAEVEKPTTPEPTKKVGRFEEKAKKISDAIQSVEIPDWLKISDEDIQTKGLSAEQAKKLLGDAVINMGKLLDKGVEFSEAVKEAVKDLVAAYGEKNRAAIEKGFADDYKKAFEQEKEEFKTEHPFLYTGTTEKKVSGFMKHIMESENVSEATKEQFKEKGIKYDAASNAEARSVAVDIVKAFGNQDALKVAEWNEVHPSVRSAIYAELIDGAFQREKNAKTDAKRIAAAQEWADLASQYDKQLTAGGQFTAYAGHFYRNSPLGFVLKENENRQDQFNEWFKGKEKSYEEIFNKILETAEGKELLSKEIDKANQEKRKAERAKREKQIDDFFDKAKMQGGTYVTVIPPAIWNGAMEVLKAATKKGLLAAEAVKQAIEYIDKELKGISWDKEKFRKEYEEKLTKVADAGKKEKTAEDYAAQLKRRKEELERRMREGDFSAEEYKEKRTLSDKEKAAKEEYDKVKTDYDEAKKQSPEWVNKKAKQFLEQFGNRMKGLTDEQKQDLVRRSIKKIAETGGLRIEEFRKMVAEVKGLKDLTPEEVTKIEGLTKKINGQEEAANKMVENPTPENIAAFKKAREESMQASLDLYNLTYKESDPLESFKSVLTLNMMGVQTLFKNFLQNPILQATVRFPGGIIKQLAELGAYGTTSLLNKFGVGQVYYPKYNIIEAQKGYFGKAKDNFKRAWFNFKQGTQEQDLFSKTSYQSTLAPKQALKDIQMWRKGEKFLTKKDLIDRAIRVTVGWQADFIARGMSFGDRIPRWAAEGAEARNIAAKELKITNPNQLEAFMVAPQKMAYKILVERGESKDAALKKSTEIQERIAIKGSEAVLEQENWLSKASKYFDVGLKTKKEDPYLLKGAKPIGSLLKTLTFPFVKIPANIYWVMFKMSNPLVSVGQAVAQSAEALNYAKKGEPGKAKARYEEAKNNMYLAAVGYGIGVAATSLVQAGLVRSSNDDDNKIRETTGERLYGKQNQLDLGKLMGGKSFWVDLNWFGPIGTQINVRSRMHDDRLRAKLKGEPDDTGFLSDVVDNLTYSATESLNNMVFENAAKTVNAIRDGEKPLRTWATNATNAFGNVFTGATYTAISKAMLPEEPRLRGDAWTDEVINNAKQRNILLRMFAGYPPSKVSIWGDPIRQDNSAWGVINNMLGFQKDSRTQFGAILYADYFKTQDPKFFPMPEDNKISVNGEQVEITQNEKMELDKYIGQARKQYVDAFVYDCVPVNVVRNGEILDVKYNQMTDKEKVEQLQQLYKDAREVGFQKFQEAFPKYATAELSPEQMIDKKLKEAFNPVNLMIIKEKAEEKENKK